MALGPITYEWECPICGTTSTGLAHGRGPSVNDQAENAVAGHVRRTDGNGHGEAGDVPPAFDEIAVAEFVRYKEQFGSRAAPGGKG